MIQSNLKMNGIVSVLALLFFVTGASVLLMRGALAQNTDPENEPRRWSVQGQAVELRATPQADAEILLVSQPGSVLSSLGCNLGSNAAWCKLRPLSGGPAGYARLEELTPARGPDGIVAVGKDDSPDRARLQDFDDEGQIACAQEVGQNLGTCDASVARGTGGDATVEVRFSNGFSRMLYFAHGHFTHASATMSGVGTDTDWRVRDGMLVIRVDDQQFEVPTKLILGF